MLCPKCGSPVLDGEKHCHICGNDVYTDDLDATVMATDPEATVMASDPEATAMATDSETTVMAGEHEITNHPVLMGEPQVQIESNQLQTVQQNNYAPVSDTKPINKNGTGLKIGIAVASVIAVVAIVFAVLIGTGTIKFNKDEEETTKVTKTEEPEIKEPEIGSISDLPVVTGDESVEKAMIKLKENKEEGLPVYIAFDNVSYSKPVCFSEISTQTEHGKITVKQAYCDNVTYYRSDDIDDIYKGQTIKTNVDTASGTILMCFGQYDNMPKETVFKFKYLGKEKLETGEAYVYELVYETNESKDKVYIDAKTGYWVKLEENGKVSMEATEILTGDDVKLPEFDFENALLDIVEPEVGSVSDLPAITGDKSIKKAMLRVKDYGGEERPTYFALDCTNESKPVIYMGLMNNTDFGKTEVHYANYDGYTYYRSDLLMQGATIKGEKGGAGGTFEFFGQYDALDGGKFRYLGKDKLDTGYAYIYEYSYSGDNYTTKLWINANTGYVVKMEEDGEVYFEVSEIITGDDVVFPELDFANAMVLEEEPEIGSVSDLPVVTGDESVGKIMMKMNNADDGSFEITYIALDLTNELQPLYVGVQEEDPDLGTMIMHQAYIGENIYYVTNVYMTDKTFIAQSDMDINEARLYFGIYNEEFLKENNVKFKYLGKEELATGDAYIYEVTTNKTTQKVWIDVDTGYWVKLQDTYEVSEIITGNSVDLPSMDFENAIPGE